MILSIVAALLFMVFLTNLANRIPSEGASGTSFSLKAQRVIACSSKEIVLVDPHDTATRLEKDGSWPACSSFHGDQVQDF